MPVPTIEWVDEKARIIDQTLLPEKLVYLDIDDVGDMGEAIQKLRIRGAPAIGVAAAMGVVIAANQTESDDRGEFRRELDESIRYLACTRPTAVNLFWALSRMKAIVDCGDDVPVSEIRKKLHTEAMAIFQEDKDICRRMGRHGAKLLHGSATVLTHCNAGGLATADFGTALGVIYAAQEAGKNIRVYADETRPLLQGARLTAWELQQSGIEVSVICDNMAGSLMQQGKIDYVIVGADRIAANGDAANKIGTYSVAVLAQHHQIPFYVTAPLSTFDFSLSSGEDIPIEERGREEIAAGFGKVTVPDGVPVYNPAFDVTPHHLVSAFITEKGVVHPPYEQTLAKIRND